MAGATGTVVFDAAVLILAERGAGTHKSLRAALEAERVLPRRDAVPAQLLATSLSVKSAAQGPVAMVGKGEGRRASRPARRSGSASGHAGHRSP